MMVSGFRSGKKNGRIHVKAHGARGVAYYVLNRSTDQESDGHDGRSHLGRNFHAFCFGVVRLRIFTRGSLVPARLSSLEKKNRPPTQTKGGPNFFFEVQKYKRYQLKK